ncbi:MAG: hypothetical protein KDI65_06225 [Alphaproteobacteria bacterium]|nr:hypothetical protein [Alphaproteobacteria bacterium]
MADPENQETTEEVTQAANTPLVEILADMREARRAYDASEISVDDFYDKIIELDQKLTLRLADRFNLRSGIRTALPESQRTDEFRSGLTRSLRRHLPSDDTQQAFIDRVRRGSSASADFFREENEEASSELILRHYIENHPQLSGLTLEDSVAIIQNTMPEEELTRKYGEVDTTVLACAIMATLQINKDRIAAEYPDIKNEITDTAIDDLAERFLTEAAEDEEYTAWEEQKRAQITTAITRDRSLMRDIAALKPLLDCTDEDDFRRQHRLRQNITERMTDIYRRVYRVPDLNSRHITTLYAPVERMDEDRTIGLTGGAPGIRHDDFSIIRNSLYREILEPQTISTDYDVTSDYLQTVMEELRHSVDLHFTDSLVNDRMDINDPVYRHTNLIFFNKLYYSDQGTPYEQQYSERTAKESARIIAQDVMAALPPQAGAPEGSPGTPQPVGPGQVGQRQ